MTTPTRPILRYHGGKWRLSPWIISHFPDHRIYVEPYGGAGSVLMRKARCYAEVWNDLDGEVVNVFRVLRDAPAARRLQELLALTPFSREDYEEAYLPADDPTEQARRTIIRAFMGFGSASVTAARHVRRRDSHRPTTGFRATSNCSGTTPAHDWAHFPPLIEDFVARLAGVVIEHQPALYVIRQHDTPATLTYCDPPYVMSTRDGGTDYAHEMTDDDHRALAELLHQAQGMVIISGYRCPLYDELYGDWRAVSKDTHIDRALARTEWLWMNAAACRSEQMTMEIGAPC